MRHLAPDLVRKAGLYLDNLHVPYFACNDLWSGNGRKREDAVAIHEAWIADCRRHGVPTMVMHVTLGRTPPPLSLGGLESFRRLAEAADGAEVTLAIENTHSAAHVDFLLEGIDAPPLGFCFDAAHDRLYSPEPLALVQRWAHRLAVLHVADIDGKRDRHWIPGDGTLDFSDVGQCLEGCGRPGTTLLESVGRPREESAESFLSRAHAAARRLQLTFYGGTTHDAADSETAHGSRRVSLTMESGRI